MFLSTNKISMKTHRHDFSKPNGVKEMIYAASKQENLNLTWLQALCSISCCSPQLQLQPAESHTSLHRPG